MSPTTHQGAVGAETMTAGQSLDLRDLHAANIARQAEWCPDQVPDLSFRGNELGGECGEAQNVIKKLERERQGWRGSRATKDDLADELADVVICADLCAVTADIDLGAAVRRKFNATSEKQGLSVFLPVPAPRTDGGMSAGEEHFGYLFHNPDTGHEWSESHPVESGEVEDAENVQPATAKALHELLMEAWSELEDARADLYTPAQPAGAVPDGLRALSEVMAEVSNAVSLAHNDYMRLGDYGGWDRLNAAECRLREMIEDLASHPAGQSAGSGTEETIQVWPLTEPAPDSTRTGDEGTDHDRLARELMGFHHALDGGVGDGAITIRCESETEQTRLALRAVLREAAAIVLAACPAAPEAQGISQAASDVLAERHRQGKVEGWTTESDDLYAYGEMARAAACYAQQSAEPKKVKEGSAPYGWPWHSSWWKPTTPRRNLVKAGALILAEIERLDRLPAPPASSGQEGAL